MEQLNFFEKLEEVNKPICPVCRNGFDRKNYKTKIYCSKKCRIKFKNDKNWKKNSIKYKETLKKWRAENKEKILEKARLWHSKNKHRVSERRRKAYRENLEKRRQLRKDYYAKNKEIFSKRNKENRVKCGRKEYEKNWYHKNKVRILERIANKEKTDPNFKIKKTIRLRILKVLKRNRIKKCHKSVDLLGCTVEEAKVHLEKQFKEGMTWENHGNNGWHIDHIIPCASFDLTDPEQQKKCFHYTNLQPLWAHENLSKGANILENP